MLRQHCSRGGGRSVETADEVRALLRRWHEHGDGAARAELAERMLPLARSLARRYVGKGEPLDDLVQVASLGLVKAIDRFDLERDVALLELRRPDDPRRDQAPLPRPHLVAPRAARPAGARARVDRAGGALARPPPLADRRRDRGRVGAGDEQVLEALEAADAYRTTSLDEPLGDGAGRARGDRRRRAGFELAEDRATLAAAAARLRRPRARDRCACASTRTSRRREIARAHRRLADAGLAAHPPVADAPARRRSSPARTRLERSPRRGYPTRHGRPEMPERPTERTEEEQERLNRQLIGAAARAARRDARRAGPVRVPARRAVPAALPESSTFQRDRLPRDAAVRPPRRPRSSSRRPPSTA